MRSLGRQKGEGKAGVIFWILVFLAAGLFAKGWIPAKISDMQLKDHIDDLAKLYPRKNDEFFLENILRRANDLNIPLERKKVQVDKTAQRVRVKVEYTQTIDLIFTTVPWTFRWNMERDIFLI